MKLDIRKTVIVTETILGEAGAPPADAPITRAAGLAVIANPFAGRFERDLSALFDMGAEIGERLMPRVAAALPGPATGYGKGALVGPLGELEHGGALIHSKLGKPMRAAIGGGKAIIPSNVKLGAPATPLDVPLSHKDDSWSFDHLDTMTVWVADAPRPHEIVVAVVLSDGGRVHARAGQGPIAS